MDNENSVDENYSELKKMFSLWKTVLDYGEFIDHAMDPWHDELKVSSYFDYIDERETS